MYAPSASLHCLSLNAFPVNPQNALGTPYQFGFSNLTANTVISFLMYHSAPAKYTFNNPSNQHIIVPTTLLDVGNSALEDGRTEPLVFQTSRDSSGQPKTIILNQRTTVNVVTTVTSAPLNVNLVIIDQLLNFPQSYSSVVQQSGIQGFDALRQAVGFAGFDTLNGFTIFAPAGDDNLANMVRSQYSSSSDVKTVFNNHVRMESFNNLPD